MKKTYFFKAATIDGIIVGSMCVKIWFWQNSKIAYDSAKEYTDKNYSSLNIVDMKRVR